MASLTKFGNYLIDKGYIDPEVVISASKKLADSGDNAPSTLASILIADFKIHPDVAYEAMAKLYAFPTKEVDVEALSIPDIQACKDLLKKIPEALKGKLFTNKIFPFKLMGTGREILTILARDTTDKLIQEIPLQTPYKKYEIYWCSQRTIEDLIAELAPQKNEFLELLEEAGQVVVEENTKDGAGLNEQALDEEINKSLLVSLYEGALIEAVRRDASDIHIIPGGKTTLDIFFRVDGKLQLWHRQESTPPEAFSAVVKDRSIGVDRFERDTAQDGFAQRSIDGHLIRFRISIIPIVSQEFERRFESIVIRVIDDRKVVTDFRKLGFQEQAQAEFLKSINTSKGIVIVTGPTGNGKSTTLMAALYQVINPGVNVLTCENPVEYVIHGARQLKIGDKMDFDQAIRAILRHDPDVVMVGEIRDKITADIAVKLANTGHLTFSTLHTNDAPSAVARLYKMGIEPFLLAYSINIIIAQRLVRKLCNNCKRPIGPDQYEAAKDLGFTQEDIDQGIIFEPVGCPKCNNGYKGRVNIAEALYFYPEIRTEIVQSKTDINEERIRSIAESKGMLSMRASGVERIRSGITSIAEVIFAASED